MPTEPVPDTPQDERLAALLLSLAADAPPPDALELQRIGAAAVQVFDTAAGSAAGVTAGSPRIRHASFSPSRPAPRSMKTLALLSASVLTLLFAWFASDGPESPGSLAFGDVLQRMHAADALLLKVTRDGATADVTIRQPGLLRWEDGSGKYQIARGSRLWRVDADADATSVENPWFGPDGGIDLLALASIRPDDRASLLAAQPTSRGEYGGRNCLVYRRSVTSDGRVLRMEAFVDAESRQLVGLIARDPQARLTAPPLAELTLLALNPVVDESQFRVPVKLAESDRIGKVTDQQGIVTLQAVGARRWTPLCREMLVQPGDWIRTDVRGANAATVELISRQWLVIGPGSLVEIISADEARLHAGSLQVVRNDQTPNEFVLHGAGDAVARLAAAGKPVYDIDRTGRLNELPATPTWLKGYEGSSAEDSIGSLIVNIDGRDVPLTVGEHHVSVEIRDQIARTTIEETFVNNTNSRTEGTFHFPLPQDASISGFGMWIGHELVEADIVEKQRAREIYETILREKRDPGLLEWTGGNIFKARVFPIEAHSEKRVKIVYTQVLPLRGNRFRYSYGLRSELLAMHPLRELNVKVLVSSAVPLASVESPTHTCRTQLTPHAAELEFTAQDYTPTKDFEVVCQVDHRENDVVVIPHRRGEDGYFLLQLMPPGGEGHWQRELLPDGEPLELILLCDTSGSMDSTMRRTQAEFVAAMLASLGDRDRFNLALCDVGTAWAFDDFTPVTADTTTKARQLLDERISLGWTDLDQAFAEVLKRTTPRTQVIYVGDGIVATTESDPAAFVNRLQRIFTAAQSPPTASAGPSLPKPSTLNTKPSFHSVSVGSAFESLVLKGIAALNGGSTRQISGEVTPQQAAFELLNEIAQPGLKDVQVEFRGVQVAAVYPESLPNIAAGTQQILVGRYLPEGREQKGEVIVTGTRNGEAVRYVARLSLPSAEEGNSFIPRLWARARLEQLLQQGASPQIQQEIIGLSEEFHIITPYTSLLVLESDADRERFKVQRRFEMRDGEKFFAQGRDDVNFALRQQQMQKAGHWRLGLRRQLLVELARLGRDASLFDPSPQMWGGQLLGRSSTDYYSAAAGMPISGTARWGGLAGGLGGAMAWDFQNGPLEFETLHKSLSERSELGARGGDYARQSLGRVESQLNLEDELLISEELSDRSDVTALALDQKDFDMPAEPGLVELREADANGYFDLTSIGAAFAIDGLERKVAAKANVSIALRSQNYERRIALEMPVLLAPFEKGQYGVLSLDKAGRGLTPVQLLIQPRIILQAEAGDEFRYLTSHAVANQLAWVEALFPALSPPRKEPAAAENRAASRTWSPEALELSRLLLRDAALRETTGGVRIERQVQHWDSNWDRLVRGGERLELWTPAQWLTRDHGQGQNSIVHWCDAMQRGVYSEAFLLGRQRTSTESDRSEWPLQLDDYSLTPLQVAFEHYQAVVERPADGRAVLTLTHPDSSQHVWRMTIDTARQVLLKTEHLSQDKLQQTTEYSDFVEVAGRWWATKIITTTAGASHPDSVTTQTVTALSLDEAGLQFASELARRADVQFLNLPLPEIAVAKQAVQLGRAGCDERFTLLVHHAATQQWEPVFEQLRALEELAAGQSGLPWARISVEIMAGRNADALEGLGKLVPVVVSDPAAPSPGVDLFLTEYLLGRAYPISAWAEYAPLVTALKPIYERQAERDTALMRWREQQLSVLSALGRSDEALAWSKEMAAAQPGNPQRQIDYAQRLVERSRDDEALAFLREQMALNHWEPGELDRLREDYADRLENRGRWTELLTFLRDWLATGSDNASPHARYLTALVMSDDVAAADATVREWLALVGKEGELSRLEAVRVETAIQFALGNGHHLYRYNNMDVKWRQPLLEVALICIPRADRHQFAQAFVDNGRFDQTDEGDRLRGHLLGWLLDGVGTLSQQRLQDQLIWLGRGRLLVGGGDALKIRQVTVAEWTQLADGILARWEAEQEIEQRHRLGQILTGLYANHLPERRLPFARRLTTDGPEKYRTAYRAELFNLLLEQPWSAEHEAEALRLWPTLTEAETKFDRLLVLIPALYRFTDAMLAGRIKASSQAQQDEGRSDALTRAQLAERQAANIKAAREGVAARLEEAQRPDFWRESRFAGDGDALQPWVTADRMYLDMLLNRNRDGVQAACWSILGEAPPRFDPQREITAEELADETLSMLLRQRAWLTVLNLAARRDAAEDLINRVLAYVDAGIEQSQEPGVQSPEPVDEQAQAVAAQRNALNSAWKQTKYDLLILLDRPDELVAALREWMRTDPWNIPWRLALARLEAERGRLKEAIELFEGVRKEDELSPADHQTLADWYLVENRRADYERSRIETYKAMEEWQLSNFLRGKANELNSGGPHELDETTLFALAALFEKTSSPGGHYWVLRELYRATQDFRLLARVPESILGRTRQQVYEALGSLDGSILQEIRKEPTADELLAHVRRLRADIEQGGVPRGADANERSLALDLRALDLIEAAVERRAAEVLNQPGPHVRAGLAALQRAFGHEWQEGERLQMASLLQNFGRIAVTELADEQTRELRQLYDDSPAGTVERARIGYAEAFVLFHYRDRREEGLRFAEAALRELAEASGGHIPEAAADLVTGYSTLLQSSGAYAEAEQYVLQQLAQATAEGERLTYEQHLNELHNGALHAMARTSLGEGATLYRNLARRLLDQCATEDMNRQYQCVSLLLQVHDHGCTRQFPTAVADLTAFANDTLPELIRGQDGNYANLLNQAAEILDRQAGKLAALSFLLTRVEQYPPRFDYEWRSAWNQHGGRLAQYRHEAAALNLPPAEELSALEERLLAVVLRELRRDLSSGESRDVGIYTLGHSHYWEAKKPDFIRTANEVLAERRDAPRTQTYVSMYLHDRIHEFNRGIEVLFAAHRRGLLDDAGVDQLIDYLHRSRRYAESIALLEAAIDAQPDRMDLRTRLMEAYHATMRPQQLAELIEATDRHFHQQGRWTEDAIYRFAQGCSRAGHHQRAAGYFEEAIALHQRTTPNRGIGDGTLSSYYQQLAGVYSALRQTKQAADAAAAAIVSWGRDPSNRQQAFNALRDALSAAGDLENYVAALDREAESTGADSPILRKALGLVYQAKNDWTRAVVQLRKSLELQPGDREVHAALLACYDALGDRPGALQQVLAQIDVDRHNRELYVELARRAAEDASLSERAATSIIEAAPSEAEHHQALAQFRQEQGRWEEALVHWRRVEELRKLEPTGLLGLAGAQAHLKQWEPLKETLRSLRQREWPAHFGDVEAQVREFERQWPRE